MSTLGPPPFYRPIMLTETVFDPAWVKWLTDLAQTDAGNAIDIVFDFGADPTNTTDSTAAIQAAINSGFRVTAPPGRFKLTSKLTVPLGRKGLEIFGTYLRTEFEATFAGPILEFPAGLTTQYIHIDGITFRASGAGLGTATGISGIAGLGYVMVSDITRCQFSGTLRYGVTGNFLQSELNRCGFGSDQTAAGTFKPIKMFATDSFQTTIRLINCEINSGNDDYVCEFQWGTDITIRGGAVEVNTPSVGVFKFTDWNLVRIEDLWVESNGAVPLVKMFDGTHSPVDSRVAFHKCFLAGNGSGANDLLIDSTNCVGKFWEITDSVISGWTHISLDTGNYDLQSRVMARYGNKVFAVAGAGTWLENAGLNHYAGTVTNDSAASGDIGEYFSASQASATNFPASTNYGDGASIVLTAGDWDVDAELASTLNGATITGQPLLGVNTTLGNSSSGLVFGDTLSGGSVPTGTLVMSCSVNAVRFSLNTTTTIYCKVRCDYTGGPPQYRCRISARRRR